MAISVTNMQSVAHKGSNQSTPGPIDVCKTPVPIIGAVPVPYANLIDGKASAGNKKARQLQKKIVDEAAKKGYKVESATQYSIMTGSAGDEAGNLKGIISSRSSGETAYSVYSFDVKFEGKNVVRMLDQTFHNQKN